ncbi:Tropinone reductase 1 [Favolaschia claudopus]|uniref:Tropinone reductase 1 n=1 Tax=Favolaschia claudopus TaxID=2862362 RepID=A0AAW0BAM2_9AGAR
MSLTVSKPHQRQCRCHPTTRKGIYTIHKSSVSKSLQLIHSTTKIKSFSAAMSDSDTNKPISAYKASVEVPPQEQSGLPGLDKNMAIPAEHSAVECWDASGRPYLKEYVGSEKLRGKKAIITGGDSGIGRTVAIFFAREGADLTINYLPEEEADAKSLKSEISKSSAGQILLVPLDLTTPGAAQKVVSAHMEKYGALDILVNNASQQIFTSDIAKLKDENILSTFQANIIQMMQLSREAIPHMKRGAAIVNTSSVVAYKGAGSLIDYSATKGAIATFTRSLATQLAPKGIRVNAVAPGLFYTPLQPASRDAEGMEGWGLGAVPLHGRVGQPAEIGQAYVLLAGPGGNYMTGTVIHVNGGVHIGGA